MIVSAGEYDIAELELKAILQQKKLFQQQRNLLQYAALHRAESLSGALVHYFLVLRFPHSTTISPLSPLAPSISVSVSPSRQLYLPLPPSTSVSPSLLPCHSIIVSISVDQLFKLDLLLCISKEPHKKESNTHSKVAP